ncbi:F-box/FBD/LRR-repeat protein-like protein [Tanacetum coccineum]
MELDYGTLVCSKDSTITKLFECLPAIESLSCWRGTIEVVLLTFCCAEDGVPQELPTALVHLKYLFIEDICFVYVGLRILVLLIRSSPNLEKLKVEIGEHDYNFEECEANFFTQKNYLHIWLEHLKELEVMEFGNRDNELDFVKLILAKSPMLKKVTIFLDEDEEVDKDEEVQILGNLYRSQRASQVVKINVM